jgi:hypothetical protein
MLSQLQSLGNGIGGLLRIKKFEKVRQEVVDACFKAMFHHLLGEIEEYNGNLRTGLPTSARDLNPELPEYEQDS